MSKRLFRFHGALSEATGCAEAILDVRTIREAIKALTVVFPKIREKWPPIQISGFNTMETLDVPIQGTDPIDLFPGFVVGKKAGFVQIIIGVAIIAVAFATAGSGGIVLGSLGTLTSVQIALTGALLVVGGLLQVLAPTPSIDTGQSKQKDQSFILGASANTADSGTRIPKAYGTVPLFGHFLSYNVDAKDRGTNGPSGDGSNGAIGPGIFGNFQIL